MDESPAIRLDYRVVTVSNWERSNVFYQDVRGAEVVAMGMGWAYRFGAQQLNLHGPGAPGDPNAAIPVPAGGSDLCFVWPGAIEQAAAHLTRHNVLVELVPVVGSGARGRGSSVYFHDPDGSLLELIPYDPS